MSEASIPRVLEIAANTLGIIQGVHDISDVKYENINNSIFNDDMKNSRIHNEAVILLTCGETCA